MLRSPSWTIIIGTGLFLLATACTTVGPDYVEPETKTPEAWLEVGRPGLAARPADLAVWWKNFGDPVLDDLIERSRHQSLDVREALLRVLEARAHLLASEADRFPTIDHVFSFQRRGESRNTIAGGFSPDANLLAVGFDASWEIDLWGRVRRSIEANEALFEASIEVARDTAVVVAAEVARHYIGLRASSARLAIAETNVRLQEETLGLVRARFESGLVGERDVAQAQSNVAATRSRVPAQRTAERAAANRLCVLLGVPPGELASVLTGAGAIPVPPLQVAIGVPADLLRRRADLRRLERQLAAETARIGVAEAQLYPQLSLFGSLGLATEAAEDLFDRGSGTFTFGPSLRWNIFDSGRLRRLVNAQEARTEQALLQWERGVLTALEEAENAMTSFVQEQVRRDSLVQAATQARRAVELARAQYAEGLTDFQSVLDSQRSVAELEDQQAESEAAIDLSLISLFKALGGGWDQGLDPAASA